MFRSRWLLTATLTIVSLQSGLWDCYLASLYVFHLGAGGLSRVKESGRFGVFPYIYILAYLRYVRVNTFVPDGLSSDD